MGIADSISMGRNQIQSVKMQMEIEQKNLAEMVCFDLCDKGYECKIVNDGKQTMRAGVVPVRIERLKIVPVGNWSEGKVKDFEAKKVEITKFYAELRQKEYKQEISKYKQKEKDEKKKK